jgi:hypothetical protein
MRIMRRFLPALLALCSVPALISPAVGGAADMWVLEHNAITEIRVSHILTTVHGTLPTAKGDGEVLVEVHVLEDGDTIPLPVYPSDGATALEEELFWTMALEDVECLTHPPSSAIEANFVGRTLSAEWSSCHNPGPTDLKFRVTVVAVRSSGSIAVDSESFGRVKSRYREVPR